MPITAVHLRNFKAFGDHEQTIPLGRRLTLIYGRNSAGKSSIIQSLLALQQSWTTYPDIQRLQTQGNRVNLGRFGNVVHRQRLSQDGNNGLTIGLEGLRRPVPGADFRDYGPVRFLFRSDTDDWSDLPWDGRLASIASGSGDDAWRWQSVDSAEDHAPRRADWSVDSAYWTKLASQAPAGELRQIMEILARSRPPALGVITAVPGGISAHLDPISIPERDLTAGDIVGRNSYDGLIGNVEQTLNAGMVSAFAREVLAARDAVLGIKHIAQTRAAGRRIYEIEQDVNRDYVGRHGGHVAQLLFNHPAVLERVRRTLQNDLKLGLVLGFNTELNTAGTGLEMLLFPADDPRIGLSLLDVGSGISQILPFVTQYAYEAIQAESGREGVIWVEQPELHLHSELQARLLGMLTHEASEAGAPQVVLETHSENLVAAARYLVQKRRLEVEDVRVIWIGVNPRSGATEALDLELTPSGGFTKAWPDGYFSERLKLLDGELL